MFDVGLDWQPQRVVVKRALQKGQGSVVIPQKTHAPYEVGWRRHVITLMLFFLFSECPAPDFLLCTPNFEFGEFGDGAHQNTD